MSSHRATLSYVLIAAGLSLLLHGILWVGAGQWRLPRFMNPAVSQRAEARPTRVSSVDLRDILVRIRGRNTTADIAKRLTESIRGSERIRALFEQRELAAPPKPTLRIRGLGSDLIGPPTTPSGEPRLASAPRPEILAIDAGGLSPARQALDRDLSPKLDRENVDVPRLPSLMNSDEVREATGAVLGAGMKLSLPRPPAPDFEAMLPSEGDNADAREAGRRTGFVPSGDLPDLSGDLGADDGPRGPLMVIDDLLNVGIMVRRFPSGGGLFRIDIQPNERSERLRGIPKDILFVMDASASISTEKLEQFKVAVSEALEYLNPQDRFNLVWFRDEANSLFGGPVPVNAANVKQAREALAPLRRRGKTDVYAGVAPFVGREPGENARPMTVFLLTDGKSTVRDSMENEELIRRVASVNRADVSVYTFSAGEGANRFLLDFLAYTNRGVGLHEPELEQFSPQLVRFIGTHSELIVSDLRYNITGGMRGSIYPKRLPHLYRGEVLSIYGRYPVGTESLAIQLVGTDASGTPQEFLYRGDLAGAPDAGKDLEIDWAAQKIFYLIAQRTLYEEPPPEINEEIRRLARRYGIYVPYM